MSRAKGDKRERQAVKIYEQAGFKADRSYDQRFGRTDYFGLYDVMAITPGDGALLGDGPEIHLAQVKSNGAAGIREWAQEAWYHIGNDIRPEYLVCRDGEGWACLRPKRTDGEITYRTMYDERNDEDVSSHRGTELNMGDGLARWLMEDYEK